MAEAERATGDLVDQHPEAPLTWKCCQIRKSARIEPVCESGWRFPSPTSGASTGTGLSVSVRSLVDTESGTLAHVSDETTTFYDRVGGHDVFAKLIRVFYEGVAGDPPLRAMYPEADLGPAEERLLLFMEQYWGGPKTYSETRGHPRLRMRHAPFAVTPEQRDRWLRHMHAAIDTLDLEAGDEVELREYMDRAAQFMVNADNEPGLSERRLPLL